MVGRLCSFPDYDEISLWRECDSRVPRARDFPRELCPLASGCPFTLVDVADTPEVLSAPERWRSSWPYRRLMHSGNR